jgi:hypothetical protein
MRIIFVFNPKENLENRDNYWDRSKCMSHFKKRNYLITLYHVAWHLQTVRGDYSSLTFLNNFIVLYSHMIIIFGACYHVRGQGCSCFSLIFYLNQHVIPKAEKKRNRDNLEIAQDLETC